MITVLDKVIQQIEAREEFLAPIPCALCWNNPSEKGAICEDCIIKNKIKVEESV
jgi:hypothetical protein